MFCLISYVSSGAMVTKYSFETNEFGVSPDEWLCHFLSPVSCVVWTEYGSKRSHSVNCTVIWPLWKSYNMRWHHCSLIDKLTVKKVKEKVLHILPTSCLNLLNSATYLWPPFVKSLKDTLYSINLYVKNTIIIYPKSWFSLTKVVWYSLLPNIEKKHIA